jgi:WD40 repeat protein
MAESWYILSDKQQSGPFSARQLKELLKSGKLKPTHQVNKGPGTRSRPVSRLPAAQTTDTKTDTHPARPSGDASRSNGLVAWLKSDRIGRFAWPSVFVGLIVVASSAAWLSNQWSDAQKIAATIIRGHQAWDSGDKQKALDYYRLTLDVLPASESATLVVQRVIEHEIENGNEDQARVVLAGALDRMIDVQLQSLDGQRLLAEAIAQRETAKQDVLVADGDGEPLFPDLIAKPMTPLPGASRELAILKPGGQRFAVSDNARSIWLSQDRTQALSLLTGENPRQGKQAGSVISWNVESGQELGRRSVSWDGEFLAMSPSGKWLVSQQPNNKVAITLFKRSKQVSTLSGNQLNLIEFSDDETRVAIGDVSTIRIHQTTTGALVLELPNVDSNVLAFSSDGRFVAYSADRSVNVINIEKDSIHSRLSMIRGRGPTALAFIPDRSDRLLVGGDYFDANVDVWDLSSQQKLLTFKAHGNDEAASQVSISGVRWHPNGESILSSSSQGRVCWWEVKGQRLLASYYESGRIHEPIQANGGSFLAGRGRLDLPELSPPKVKKRQLMPRVLDNEVLICDKPDFEVDSSLQEKFGFSQDGRLLVAPAKAAGSRNILPRFFDVESGERLAPMSYESDMRLFSAIKSSRILPWRPAINSADWYGLFRFRSFVLDDPDRASLVRDLCGSPTERQKNTLSPDGSIVAIGGTRPLSFHDTRTGQEIVKLQARDHGNYKDFMECIIAPDNKSVAMVWYQDGVVWDLATGRQFIKPFSKTGTFLEYSQDGKYLAVIDDDGLLKFWSTSDWTEAASFEPPKFRQEWAGFNPSATHFATIMHTATGREVKIWNIATRKIETTIDARHVVSVRFIHDDRLWIWENAQRRLEDRVALYSNTGRELARIRIGQGAEVTKVRFSPSGRHVATFSQPGSLRVWDIYKSR